MVALIIALSLFVIAIVLFIHFIIKRDRGHKEPRSALFAAMGFGVLAVLLAGELNSIFIPREIFEAIQSKTSGTLPGSTLFISAMKVGVIEETLKILPLTLFIYRKSYFDELTDGIIYFGITALTFGILEDISYTIQFGAGVGIFRIIISPYLHAGFTILFGMYLVQHKVLKRPWLVVLAGYLAAVFSHGIYDYFAFSGGVLGIISVLVITVSLNVGLFVFYRRAQKIDESRGQSAIGINKFCRNCGKPNPKRLLYCSSCGKHS